MDTRKETHYEAPSETQISEFFTELNASKTDRQTAVDFLKNLDKLLKSHPNRTNILIGAFVYFQLGIENENRYRFGFSSPTRSKLYKLIISYGLQLHAKPSKNTKVEAKETKELPPAPLKVMKPDEQLAFLTQFYKFAAQESLQLPDDEYSLITSTDKTFKLTPDLQEILITRPELPTLIKSTENMHDEYEKSCSERTFNPNVDHKKFSLFLLFLRSNECNNIILKMLPKIDNDKLRNNILNAAKFKIIYGTVLYMMSHIEKEYRHVWEGNPERSELYRLCQHILNIGHTRDLPGFIKIGFFASFRKFIRETIETSDAIDLLKSYTVKQPSKLYEAYNGGINLFRKAVGSNPLDSPPTKFDDAKYFLQCIDAEISNLQNEASVLSRATQNLANYAKSSGRNALLFKGSTALYQLAFAGSLVTLAVTGGSYVAGGGYLVRLGISTIVAPQEAATMIGAIATAIPLVMNFAYETISPPKDNRLDEFDEFEKFNQQILSEVSENKWTAKPLKRHLYEAIVTLPSTVISQQTKDRFNQAIVKPMFEKEMTEIKPESKKEAEEETYEHISTTLARP